MQTRLEAPAQEPRNVLGPDGEIRLAGVSRAFARRDAAPVPALADVSLRVAPARSSPSSGPSGCGKTTLLELVCGLQAPDAGTVARRARRADAPARPAAAVADARSTTPRWRCASPGAGRDEARERGAPAVRRASASTASSARARTSCRAACASASRSLRTLLSGKPVLCLDEPFGALDAMTRARDAGRGWPARSRGEPRTVLLVTHDVEEAVAARRPRRRALAAPRARRRRARRRRSPRPRARDRPGARRACASARWRRCAA